MVYGDFVFCAVGVVAQPARFGAPLLPDRSKMTQERAVVGETGLGAEEGKPSRPVQFDQPGEEQAAKERAQHPHRQQEGRAR